MKDGKIPFQWFPSLRENPSLTLQLSRGLMHCTWMGQTEKLPEKFHLSCWVPAWSRGQPGLACSCTYFQYDIVNLMYWQVAEMFLFDRLQLYHSPSPQPPPMFFASNTKSVAGAGQCHSMLWSCEVHGTCSALPLYQAGTGEWVRKWALQAVTDSDLVMLFLGKNCVKGGFIRWVNTEILAVSPSEAWQF